MTADPFYEGLPGEMPELRRCEPGEHVEPVAIEHTLVCSFKAKTCGLCDKPKSNPVHRKKNVQEGKPFCAFKRRNGCAHCGKAKNDPDHLGAPESFNVFASGGWEAYQGAKKRWHVVLDPLLRAGELPLGLAHVMVEGECSFGDDRERDQGNHRVVIEKALGDVLVEGGWLAGDKWHQYEFGGLRRVEEPGVNRIRLMLFPSAPRPAGDEPAPAQGALL